MRGEALHRVLLGLCLALPWLNPFTRPPSAAAWPLLFSWMCAACALMLVADMVVAPMHWPRRARWQAFALVAVVGASVLWVPAEVDRALTLGLLAAGVTVVACAVVARRAAQHPGWAGAVIVAWLGAAVLSSLIALAQYLEVAAAWRPWVNLPPDGVAYANLRQRNQFATLTAIGLVSLYGGLLWHFAREQVFGTRWRVTAWCVLQVLAAGAAVSLSRTGLFEWLALPLLMWLWCRRTARGVASAQSLRWLGRLALGAPVSLLLWSLLMPAWHWLRTDAWGGSLMGRLSEEVQAAGSCGSRRVLWDNALTMIAQQPWWGWGWGETDYAQFMTRFAGARFCELMDNAHNLVLQLALDFGVPLALVLCVLAVRWVWQRRPWRETQPLRLLAWGVLLVLLIHSLLEYPLWYGPFQMALGLALGWLWHTDASASPVASTARASLVAPLTVGVALFCACLYAAWDYHRISQIYLPRAVRDAVYRDDPIAHARHSWLFRNPVEFAELTLQAVTPENAARMYPLALRVMHYSPEAPVVQRAIDAARQLGLDQAALTLANQLQAAQAGSTSEAYRSKPSVDDAHDSTPPLGHSDHAQ